MHHSDVLILSSPEDAHFQAIDWALRRIGLRTALLYGNCFPQDESHTLRLDSQGCSYSRVRGAECLDLLDVSVVWNRRSQWPVPSAELPDSDRAAALREAEMFVDGVRSLAALRQRWVNAPDADVAASRKPYQLDVARHLGLKIPRTIMSNDPQRIRRFFEEAPGAVVLKPFHALQWISDRDHYMLFAEKLRFEDIEDPEALRLTSHIFQDYVEKRYELRIFCLGDQILAYKLHSQEQDSTRTDWRVSVDGSLRTEPYLGLPQAISDSIRRYMRHMRLEYGAFDFIVDRDGEYVFLECNVSGQFLFIEEWNPECRLLAEFIRFLTSDMDLTPRQLRALDELRFFDFQQDAQAAADYNGLIAAYGRRFTSRNVHREVNLQ
jgi:glutathione synthase/RimK-type ligase-like ATP-grasp enzyme